MFTVLIGKYKHKKQIKQMVKEILVPRGTVKALAEEFQCTPHTVHAALNGGRKSARNKLIRKAALTRYGGVYSNFEEEEDL